MLFLKKNAEYFNKKAKEAFQEKNYKFVLFFIEQSIQLYIKYILFKFFGDYPKTHKFKELFEELSKINEKIINFYEENSDVFDLIEESYITSRYLDKEYSKKSAEKALNILEQFKKELKRWLA